jgi:hypothetical protein
MGKSWEYAEISRILIMKYDFIVLVDSNYSQQGAVGASSFHDQDP